MHTTLYWFRHDLRLHDARALQQAAAHALAHHQPLVLVYVHDVAHDAPTAWGFRRMGQHRRRFLAETLCDLQTSLHGLGQELVFLKGDPVQVLLECAQRVAAVTLFCEDIAAPEEQAQIAALKQAGLQVHPVWQSSLLEPENLPFNVTEMPQVFTTFRQKIEAAGVRPLPPLERLSALPPPPAQSLQALARWPALTESPQHLLHAEAMLSGLSLSDSNSLDNSNSQAASSASGRPASTQWVGGESRALAHVAEYLTPPWPDRYKQTRNALQGQHTSSHWSPWLATGALSARAVWAALQQYEHTHGDNEGTYWLWFELLWRDNFRFLHLQHGRQLYAARGLSQWPRPSHFPKDFQRWCNGNTGEPIVDAGMRELAATGFTSNRMRQIVASYLVHDLACDWRAGAAWFEAQLVDFDVYSNQGNWLYVSGRGTDPRQGRRFNPQKQTQDHDPQGRYRQVWLGR